MRPLAPHVLSAQNVFVKHLVDKLPYCCHMNVVSPCWRSQSLMQWFTRIRAAYTWHCFTKQQILHRLNGLEYACMHTQTHTPALLFQAHWMSPLLPNTVSVLDACAETYSSVPTHSPNNTGIPGSSFKGVFLKNPDVERCSCSAHPIQGASPCMHTASAVRIV